MLLSGVPVLWIMASRYLDLTIDEKVKIVRLYSINGENAEMTRKQLYQEGIAAGRWDKVGVDRAPLPPRTTIININRVFNETGSLALHPVRFTRYLKS